MYIPLAFQVQDLDTIAAFMRRNSFATIVTNGEHGLIASHVPLIVQDRGAGANPALLGHLARANSHWQEFDGSREALVIFQGPHGYVSPSLYEVHPSVPTWNYQVVHAYGVPRLIDDDTETQRHVLELARQHEASSTTPWHPQLPQSFLEGMLRQIVSFEIDAHRVEAKFKLSQNRTRTDRENVAAAFEHSDDTVSRALGQATREALD